MHGGTLGKILVSSVLVSCKTRDYGASLLGPGVWSSETVTERTQRPQTDSSHTPTLSQWLEHKSGPKGQTGYKQTWSTTLHKEVYQNSDASRKKTAKVAKTNAQHGLNQNVIKYSNHCVRSG